MNDSSHISEELSEFLAAQVDRGVRKGLRRYTSRALIGFLVLFAAALFGFHDVNKRAVEAERQAVARDHLVLRRIDTAVFGSCRRVNILRAQSNLSDSVSFVVLANAGQAAEKNGNTEVAKIYFMEASKLTVTPLTNCNTAVKTPTIYQLPKPGPIGDPKTGNLSPETDKIVRESTILAGLD